MVSAAFLRSIMVHSFSKIVEIFSHNALLLRLLEALFFRFNDVSLHERIGFLANNFKDILCQVDF